MSQARALYRQILRTARTCTWISAAYDMIKLAGGGGEKEKSYILTEARKEFELKRRLTDAQQIQDAIIQGEQRLDVGIHYRNPYPRPTYVDPGTVGGDKDFRRKSNRNQINAGQIAQKARVNKFKWK